MPASKRSEVTGKVEVPLELERFLDRRPTKRKGKKKPSSKEVRAPERPLKE